MPDDHWEPNRTALRDPAQVIAHWDEAGSVEPTLLRAKADDTWWQVLHDLGVTLLVTREYEHLVLGLGASDDGPRMSYLRVPHPSGMVVDRVTNTVYLASTRNPNQVFALRPAAGGLKPLVPVRTTFYPGSLFLHDLALIAGKLFGNAVGQNAVVALDPAGTYARAWWPRTIEGPAGPDFAQNHLQLNSIAAAEDLEGSYYSASAAAPCRRRPGQRDFRVDGTGVIFSGRTREPMAWGLTRPHSARLFKDRLWVANSGYGNVGIVESGRYTPAIQLCGWTRGLCFVDTPDGGIMFVGTSRVLPRFSHYAPGITYAICGVHAVQVSTGVCLASITWTSGNQIFAIDWLPSEISGGLPMTTARSTTRRARARRLFFTFQIADNAQ